MSAGIIFGKKQVEKAFTDRGCKKVPNKGFRGQKTGSYDMWQTPWGHEFMAPVEGCGHWVIAQIIEQEIDGTDPAKNKALN